MDLRRPVGLVALAAMAAPLLALAGTASAQAPMDSPVVINEIHYDNAGAGAGADVGEFVEVTGPVGTDLTGWTVVVYSGTVGAAYRTQALTGSLTGDSGSGFGLLAVPTAGIQNGYPDGDRSRSHRRDADPVPLRRRFLRRCRWGIALEGVAAPVRKGAPATATLTVADDVPGGRCTVEITATSRSGGTVQQPVCTVLFTVATPISVVQGVVRPRPWSASRSPSRRS